MRVGVSSLIGRVVDCGSKGYGFESHIAPVVVYWLG